MSNPWPADLGVSDDASLSHGGPPFLMEPTQPQNRDRFIAFAWGPRQHATPKTVEIFPAAVCYYWWLDERSKLSPPEANNNISTPDVTRLIQEKSL
jgi:hypothetical protein